MNDCIIFEGIQTNNLKNIDIALKKRQSTSLLDLPEAVKHR